jgi:hypothetical protein
VKWPASLPAPTQDLLKKLYHRLVPPHIRKALGEFYTPDWLAQRVLNMLDGGQYRGRPEVRILDPIHNQTYTNESLLRPKG